MKAVVLALAAMAAASALAARSPEFGADAFSEAVAAGKGTAVFSPLAFELDAVIMADAFDPLVKAHFAETLGVLTGLEGTYVPMVRYFAETAATNRLQFVSARAFLVPDYRKVSAAYRQELERNYQAEVCRVFPKTGAECWFKARMDGLMEDFEIPMQTAKAERNSFYDLVDLRLSWAEPFALEDTRKVGKRELMCDIREVDLYAGNGFEMARLPMADGAWIYFLKPDRGRDLAAVRTAMGSKHIGHLLSVMGSVTEPGVYHGPAVVGIPRLDIRSSTDIAGAMAHFKFPAKGYLRLNGDLTAQDFRQICRFRLDEQGLDMAPCKVKPDEKILHANADTRKFVLTGPFGFFVYHERTNSILVMGEFAGN